MTLPLTLRGSDGRRSPALIRAVVERAEHLVATEPSLGGSPPPEVVTLGAALAYACDPTTTRAWEAGPDQLLEWRRASDDTLAVVDANLPLQQVHAATSTIAAMSAMCRVAAGVGIPTWRAALARASNQLKSSIPEPKRLIELAYHEAMAASPTADRRTGPISLSWGIRTAQLLRAMLRYADEEQPTRFSAARGYRISSHLKTTLSALASTLGHSVATTPFQPRHDTDACRDVLRLVTDPRYRVRALLASVANAEGALRVLRNDIEPRGTLLAVRVNRGSQERPQVTWYRLGPRESDALRSILETSYATVEQQAREQQRNYCVIGDVHRDGEDIVWREDAALATSFDLTMQVDPRTILAAMLGIEGRSGQVARAWRSDLSVERNSGEPLFRVPGFGKKRGPSWLLAATQMSALAFEMEVGYLADLERAYRAGTLLNYPLFPQGRSKNGRFAASSRLAPVNERTVKDWARDIEDAIGIEHVDGRGHYGWRRAFSDLYEPWSSDRRAKDLLTGHAKLDVKAHGSTREQVYLDPQSVTLLREARRLVEHARTLYVRTGAHAKPEST